MITQMNQLKLDNISGKRTGLTEVIELCKDQEKNQDKINKIMESKEHQSLRDKSKLKYLHNQLTNKQKVTDRLPD